MELIDLSILLLNVSGAVSGGLRQRVSGYDMATKAATEHASPPSVKPKGSRARNGSPFGGGIPLALFAIAVTAIGFWRTFF